jgi:hypothetical protein
MMESRSAISVLVSVLAVLMVTSPAGALTSKECSAKYQAAKSAGTLAGKTWNDFRKTECAANTPAATTTEPATKPAATTEPAKTTEPSKETAPAKPAATTSTTAVFPTAVSSKYASEKAGRARMHTCLDQYNANKAKDANGGLKWIEKGGGYYSECNKRLKG